LLSVWIEDRTRRQPREVRPQPWGAASESDGPRHFAIPKRAKRKGKMAGQRGP
ncbi:unnamed protein product, partial [Ascophyllum nodosum]